MNDRSSPEQVYRIDGKGVFMEVMLSCIHLDKVVLNFMQYDNSQESGNKSKGEITIYLDMYEAVRLSRDIMSGRIPKLGEASKKKAKEQNSQYPMQVFESLGGTPAKKSTDGVARSRVFSISPGSNQPWVFCAKQGKGRETKEGLIVMDGKPDLTIRVPATAETLKEVALAIETVFRVWEQARFAPVVQEKMRIALERRQENINQAKDASASRYR